MDNKNSKQNTLQVTTGKSVDKINTALAINEVLSKLYSAIDNYSFNINKVDLSKIDNNTLKNFWIYTSGFLCMQYAEEQEETLGEKGIQEILLGNFKIKTMPLAEAEDFANEVLRASNQKEITRDRNLKLPSLINLPKIQDGKYYLKKNNKISTKECTYYDLILETEPVKIINSQISFDYNPKLAQKNGFDNLDILRTITNVFAHSSPDQDGNKLLFHHLNGTTIKTTKMWLRGYSEMFANSELHKEVDINTIETKLKEYLKETNNDLSDYYKLYQCLLDNKELIPRKDYLEKKVLQMFTARVQTNDYFYKMPLNKKIELLAQIISKNHSFYKDQKGLINPSIIYSLQQLISNELSKRDLKEEMFADSEQEEEIKATIENNKQLKNQLKGYFEKLASGNASKADELKSMALAKEMNANLRNCEALLTKLEDLNKLETSLMKMYQAKDLEWLNVETANHIVLMMTYNALITSGFFEDVLANVDASNLNNNQIQFLEQLNLKMNSLVYKSHQTMADIKHYNDTKTHILGLSSIRHCIRHSQFHWYPPYFKNESHKFNDSIIFFTGKYQPHYISAPIKQLKEIFGDKYSIFFKPRHKGVVTSSGYHSPID